MLTPTQVLIITLAAPALAATIALAADIASRAAAGRVVAALVLLVGGAAVLVAGWGLEPVGVWGGFIVGAGRSTAAGLVVMLAAASLLSQGTTRSGLVGELTALGAGGAAIALSSVDLIAMLIGIEIAAVSAYGIVARSAGGRAGESAMKYFIQGSAATGMFVLGLGVVVGLAAPDAQLATLLATGGRLPAEVLMLGGVGLMGALLLKSGAAPMHSWAPDVYESAPAEGAAFMAGPLKLAMVVALATVAGSFGTIVTADGPLGPRIVLLMGGVGIASVVLGSTTALQTRSYARLLGYAGVAQVGYALIAIAAMNLSTAMIFISTYAVGTTGAFAAAAAVRRLRPDWDGSVESLAGIGRSHPVLGVSLTVVLMSLAGIPPLLGFWGKLLVFVQAIATSAGYLAQGAEALGIWLAALTVAGIAGSVVSLGYYGSIVRAVYSETPPDLAAQSGGEGARAPIAVVATIASVLAAAGVAPIFIGISQFVTGFLLTLS